MPEYENPPPPKYKPYEIKKRQRDNAKKLGVEIRPSENKLKKLDVLKDGKVISQIGGRYQDGIWYPDYATLLQNPKDRYGNTLDPEERRLLYIKRHAHEDKFTKGTRENRRRGEKQFRSPSFYADKILWS